LSLAGPVIDQAYVEHRLHVGEAHERIGLAPRWYLGAYALYFSLMAPMVYDALRGDPERAERTLVALEKLLLFDAQLAIDAYIQKREHQLEYLNRELARQVEERTSELDDTRRRVRAAEELASVGTLAAGLAHEIGTPMGVIRGHAEMLEAAVSDDRSRWRLHTITQQIDRISGIIEALLNLARPREPVRAPTALAAVINDTLSFVAEKLAGRHVGLELDLAEVPLVLGDAEKLQQLLLNLIMNAIDAMPDGGTLGIHLGGCDDGVEVRISDTGKGMPPHDLGRIFDPFYTTKGSGAGFGLGLAVANGIVVEHGGSIEVESALAEGTEFRILLPGGP
jgi:two-component system NtrC family sensor kinase